MKWGKFCKEPAEREQTDRQRIQKTAATVFPDGSSGEHSTLQYSHSTVGDAVHYLISMVMTYCTESIAKCSTLQYNILHRTIPKHNTIYCTLL